MQLSISSPTFYDSEYAEMRSIVMFYIFIFPIRFIPFREIIFLLNANQKKKKFGRPFLASNLLIACLYPAIHGRRLQVITRL